MKPLYNINLIHNHFVRKAAGIWFKQDLFDDEKLNDITKQYSPVYKTQPFLVRLGLFVFILIGIQASAAFASFSFILPLLNYDQLKYVAALELIVFGSACIWLLRYLIKEKEYFRQGIDEALLYSGISYIISGIFYLLKTDIGLEFNWAVLWCSFLAIPILFFASVIFCDALAAVLCFFSALLFLVEIFYHLSETVLLLSPFFFLIVSYIGNFYLNRLSKKYFLRFWYHNIQTVRYILLLLFYLSGNIFVVNELYAKLMGGGAFPLAWVFYVLTITIPVWCLYSAIKNKDRILLHSGLFFVFLSIASIRYYHSLLPAEWGLTLGGVIILSVSIFSIRFLKNNNLSFTFSPSVEGENLTGAELLFIVQQFGKKNATTTSEEPKVFNGGEFGGGGSEGNF